MRSLDSRLHKESLSTDFASAFWDPESQTKATSMLYSFGFAYNFLSHLAGITVKLQGETLDIVDTYNGISGIVTFQPSLRRNIDNNFYNFPEHAKRMATAVNIEPSKPRSCSSRERPKAVACTVEEWYKINVAIPFIDNIISDLESRFSSHAKTASLLLVLCLH